MPPGHVSKQSVVKSALNALSTARNLLRDLAIESMVGHDDSAALRETVDRLDAERGRIRQLVI